MKARIAERFNTMIKEAKRPFAWLLVLCMIVTLIPFVPNVNIGTEVFADGTVSGNTTISSDTIWVGATTVSDGVTITINPNCTLKVEEILTLGSNVTVTGGGILDIGGTANYVKIVGDNVKFGNLTIISTAQAERQASLIISYTDQTDVEVTIDSVVIQDSVISATNNLPSVFLFNYPNKNHKLHLKGETQIINNSGGKVGAIGYAFNNSVEKTCKVYVQDSVQICSNENGSGDNANIRAVNANMVEISDDLSGDANIGITPADNASPFTALDSVSSSLSARETARDAFFMDDFHNYGVTIDGDNLKPIAKSTMTVTTAGLGVIEAIDTRGRNIISASTGATNTTYTIKEVAGRLVSMRLIPDEDNFVKSAVVNGVNKKDTLIVYDLNETRKRNAVFDAFNGANSYVIFEQAITSVDIDGIIAPYGFLDASDSLAGKTVGSKTPSTATVDIVSAVWKQDSSVVSQFEWSAIQTNTYTLELQLSASGGSQFASTVTVNAAEGTGTCTNAGDTLMTVSIQKAASKMPLSVAEALHYVTFTAISNGDAVYDGDSHGPIIRMEDSKGGQIDLTSSAATVTKLGNPVTADISASAVATGTYEFVVEGPANAGSYLASVAIANTIYDGTKNITGLSYTIEKKNITPTAIDITGANKYYDGTPAVTAGAITFDGLVNDSLTKGTDYTATFAFDSANAGARNVEASGIALTSTDVASNYVIDPSVNSFIQAGALISKATPVKSEGSLLYDVVNAPGTKLSEINFHLGTLFRNPHKASSTPDVVGTLAFQELNPGTVEILKNQDYGWIFHPSDTTNYNDATGTEVFWPVAPIKTISLSGITLPAAGATNNITTNAISGVTVTSIGPSSGCEITIVSAEWKEHNPNTNSDSTLDVGDKFKYNRTYTLELTMNASATDKFATGGALAVDFTTDGATRNMTSVSVSETQAKFSYLFVIGKGTLTDSMFAVPADLTAANAVTYKGIAYNCTIASIAAEIDDGYLEYRTNNGNWSSWTSISSINGLTGYKDASDVNYTYTIQIRHPDYNGTPTKTYDIKINKKPIDTSSIELVETRPYNNTSMVNVTIGSIDIVAGDDIVLTADSGTGRATISNPNYSTSSVTVTANDIIMSGSSSGNYILTDPAKTATRTYPTGGIIQKVTPTGGSVTFAAVTTASPRYDQLNVQPQGFINEYITGANEVAGTIESYFDSGYTVTVSALVGNMDIQKRHPYYWKFIPTGAAAGNYNVVEGGPVQYWPGTPITTATLTGIALPTPMVSPTAMDAIHLELNDTTTDITVTAISWQEIAPTELADRVSDRALGATDIFYYNRLHVLTVTLSSLGNIDDFNTIPTAEASVFAGKIDIGGDLYDCTTQFVMTGDKAYTAVLTCTFNNHKTNKGTLSINNLEFRDFASYTQANGTVPFSDGLRGEYTGQTASYSYAYVYTGRWVGPNPKVYGLSSQDPNVQGIQEPQLAEFTYSVDGGVHYSDTPPRYKDKTSPTSIRIKLEHPDYSSAGDVFKDLSFELGPCVVRPEGIVYTGKAYDGTTAITGAKLLWYPQNSGFDGATGTAISEDLIDYTAHFEFDGANVGTTKNVLVTNIDAESTNFICQIDDLPAKNISKQSDSSFTYTGGIPIWKANVKPKTGSILTKSISSGVSLSAIYDEYMVAQSNASTGAVMVNVNNTALGVHGRIDLLSGGAVMTHAEMENEVVVQGQGYTWQFTPDNGSVDGTDYSFNYALTTGTQILWPFPPPTPSYGGGGGGGAAPAPTKAAVSTLSGVIATPGSFSTQIHVYLASGGSIVTDKAFFARVTGAAVDRALTAMPDGNVVVDRDGNIIAKAIIADGKLKAYLIGDNYLTIQRRKVDYIDVPGHWFEPYVDFCSVRDIMNGTGENKFSPNDTLTRAMAATILYRLEGSQTLTASNTRRFADVDDGKWYTDGIAWAGGTGIVNGIGIKNFAPHWDITREQMAVMIYNYCCTMCGAQPVPSGSLDRSIYGDGNKIASWAQDAVAYCTKVGLMKGNDKGDFCPKDTATRAEFATIIERLIEGFLDGNL